MKNVLFSVIKSLGNDLPGFITDTIFNWNWSKCGEMFKSSPALHTILTKT